MGFWRVVVAIAGKDLRAELRRRRSLAGALVFALLVILTFSFVFDTTRLDPVALLPGVLWVTIFFAGMLALERLMASERQADAFSALLASPGPPEAVFFGKLTSALLFTAVVEAVALPVLAALLRVSLPGSALVLLAGVMALGTMGFVSAGTLLAAMTCGARSGELVLPLLLLPLAVPTAIGSVEATAAVVAGWGPERWGLWVRLLAAYDAVMLALPAVLFRYLLEG